MLSNWGQAKVLQCDCCGRMETISFRKNIPVDGIDHDFCGLQCEQRYKNTKLQERRDFHYDTSKRNGN